MKGWKARAKMGARGKEYVTYHVVINVIVDQGSGGLKCIVSRNIPFTVFWPNEDGSALSIPDRVTHLIFMDNAHCWTECTHTWVIGQPNDEHQASAP